MDVLEIPRFMVRTSFQAARLPLTAAEAVLRRGEHDTDWAPTIAFEAFEANVKQIVGSVLHDEQLADEGRLEQAKVAQLRKAIELEAVAEQRKAEADRDYQQRHAADEARRQQVKQSAEQRESALEQERISKLRQAEERANEQQAKAEQDKAAADKAIAKQERAARRTKVTAERQALRKERDAVVADSEVIELDHKLEATKAARTARTATK